MPSKSSRTRKSAEQHILPSSHHKVESIPKAMPLAASHPCQSYVVVDTTLPSHVINDHSLFTTYTPGRKVHRTALGHEIIIEGTGDAEIRVFAAGQYICFRMRNCWHVPSSSHHFLSCTITTSSGYQVMITARTPRILFPNSRRLAEPRLPKYVPLTKVDGFWVLKFERPAQVSISPQLLSTAVQTAAQATNSLHASMYQLEPFAALSVHQPNPNPNLPLLSFAPVDFQSAAMVSMVSQYNTLFDARCTHHIVRDRHLFHSYAEKSFSMDTANCGSLKVLGIGDVEFRCPFRDRHVVFTLRGCLYAPDAPINLLSVGTLVERGMSCLFSSGGLAKVFYPQNHVKLPGFTFSPFITNHLSFLKLVFHPPVDFVSPKHMPFKQASSSSSYRPFAGLAFNQPLPTQPPSPQQPNFCFSLSSVGASVGGVSHGGEDCEDHDGLVDEVHEDYIGLKNDATSTSATSHGGEGEDDRMTPMDMITEAELEDKDTKHQVASTTTSGGDPNNRLKAARVGEIFIARLSTSFSPRSRSSQNFSFLLSVPSFSGSSLQNSILCLHDSETFSPTSNTIWVEDSLTLRPSTHFLPHISSLTSTLNSTLTYLLSSFKLLSFPYNNFPLHFSPIPSFSTLILSPFFVYLHFEVSSLPSMTFSPVVNSFRSVPPFTTLDNEPQAKVFPLLAIIFPIKCSRAAPFHLNSTSGRCHGVTSDASGCGAFAPRHLPSLFQTNPGIPCKFPVPDVIVIRVILLARSHWHTNWSTCNDAIVESGRLDGEAMISNVEGVVIVFKGWSHEGHAGFIKTSIPYYAPMHHRESFCSH